MEKTDRNPAGSPTGLRGALGWKGIPVLRYDIGYPRVTGKGGAPAIGAFYRKRAGATLADIRREFYPQAVNQYKALSRSDSFAPLEVTCTPCVMYQGRGLLSLFTDTFEDLGASGSHVKRFAETWRVSDGSRLPLSALFRQGSPWAGAIRACVARDIEKQNQETRGSYYFDWKRILPRALSQENYYLADDGVAVFFSQELLAPRSTGVPTFLIPYEELASWLVLSL